MTTENILDGFVDDDEIATDFGVCKRTVQRWRRQGKLPPTSPIGNLTHVEDLRKRLKANRIEDAA